MNRAVCALSLGLIGLAASTASAAFVKIDDFQSYGTGNVVSPWTVDSPSSNGLITTAQITASGSNQYLSANASGGYIASRNGVTGPSLGTGDQTVFFQLKQDKGDVYPQVHIEFSDGNGVRLQTDGYGSANTFHMEQTFWTNNSPHSTSSLQVNQWYNIWAVAHTGGGVDIYAQGLTDMTPPTLITATNGTMDGLSLGGNFRVSFVQGGPNTTNIDNLYVSQSVDLSNPIPEPTSFAMVGLSAGSLLTLRRRRA